MIEAYRLHSNRYPANSGKGAALRGGRWNHAGIEAIYAAQSRSLAALEILVHYSVLPKDFLVTPVRIPDDLVCELSGTLLAYLGRIGISFPQDWQTNSDWHNNLAATRDFGRPYSATT